MISGLVRHSTFRSIRILQDDPITLVIEADEAYISVLKQDVYVYVERQRERALAQQSKEIPFASFGIEGRASITWGMGFVNLNARPNTESEMVIDPAQANQRYPLPSVPTLPNIGIRDTIVLTMEDFNENSLADVYILIEEVHYVPADAVGI